MNPRPSGDVLSIDMETRSLADLAKVGAYAYAEHPSTEILCMAWAIGDAEPQVWTRSFRDAPDVFRHLPNALIDHIANGGRVRAWNAGFERALWSAVCVGRFGFPEIPLGQWVDAMAVAAVAGYPLSLDKAAAALGLAEQKDAVGRRIMLKFCKPLPKRKSDAPGTIRWADDPAEFAALMAYCAQDVRTERAICKALPELTEEQQATWELTQRINDRGLPLDVAAIATVQRYLDEARRWWAIQLQAATGGTVTLDDLTATARLKDYLTVCGIPVADMTKATVSALLERDDLPDAARLVLQGRASVGRSSTAKLDAMAACVNADGRVRGTLCYHGAHTGRWAGRLVQPQNMPSEAVEDVDEVLADMSAGVSVDLFRSLWGDPFDAAAGMVRGMIAAPAGRALAVADYSAIEARVLAWLAGEEWRLEVFRTHGKIYEASASVMFGIPLDAISKTHPARKKGKISELALGYQGGAGALKAMGAIEMGLTEDELPGLVAAWRAANPAIVSYWRDVEQAARGAARDHLTAFPAGSAGRIVFKVSILKGLQVLRCRLPSGRILNYPEPKIVVRDGPYGPRECLSYLGVNSITHQWVRIETWGGRLVENIVQAVSYDLMVHGLKTAKAAGFDLLLTVHDEAVAEVPEGSTAEALEKALATLPAWARGLPFDAEGYVSRRYRK